MRNLDATGDGLLSIDEWNEAFPEPADSEPSTQLMLANLVLNPKPVRELHEGAVDTPKQKPIPKQSLAAFKFKLKSPKGFTQVWSNKGSSSRDKFSVWSADVEGGGGAKALVDWKRNSRVRVSLGTVEIHPSIRVKLGRRGVAGRVRKGAAKSA